MELLKSVLISLVLTLALELLVAIIMRVRGQGLIIVILVNALTNPIVVLASLLIIRITGWKPVLAELPFEAVAWTLEALIYRHFKRENGYPIPYPVGLAIVSNAVSWGAGLAIELL